MLGYRDSKISQLLRDSLGNVTCRTCMLAHVSSAVPHYNETLQVIQLAARIHRMKRRRTKVSDSEGYGYVSRFGLVARLVRRGASVRIRFGSSFTSKVVVCGRCLVALSLTVIKH